MDKIPYRHEYKSTWYHEHKDEIKAKRKIHYEENRERILAQMKTYRESNKEKVATAKAKCYYESKEEYSQKRKEYYASNKEKICANVKKYREANSESIKERNRKKKYGIEEGTFDKMILEQDNKCLVCGNELGKGKAIAIDHCHTSGDVMGILCSRCNLMLGMVEDNVEILNSAIEYLRRRLT